MNRKMKNLHEKVLIIFAISLIICTLLMVPANRKIKANSTSVCRFGITSPTSSSGYYDEISSIGVGSFLNWGAANNPTLPPGVEFTRVLRVADYHEDFPISRTYTNTIDNLNTWVTSNPGSVWMIGNEPDRVYWQDSITPEVYADRYYAIATQIRTLDPTAQLGYGTIVQPTPIRMRYLDRAWSQLITLAGSSSAASDLVDIWSIHAFILNESPISWGAGIPPGFESDYGDAVPISITETYSITIFQDRTIAFRDWMEGKGEEDKPLWITEYGSLMPSVIYPFVSDEDSRDFMLDTFDFMLSATDPTTGLSTDGDRLVQSWYWYSLNDHRYNFGGSLFDPDDNKAITPVGIGFRDYRALSLAQPDLFPIDLSVELISYDPGLNQADYQLDVVVGNAMTADTGSSGQVFIHDGDPGSGGTLIAGPVEISSIQRCGGIVEMSIPWNDTHPFSQKTLYVSVNPIGVADGFPDNNVQGFQVIMDHPIFIFLPLVIR